MRARGSYQQGYPFLPGRYAGNPGPGRHRPGCAAGGQAHPAGHHQHPFHRRNHYLAGSGRMPNYVVPNHALEFYQSHPASLRQKSAVPGRVPEHHQSICERDAPLLRKGCFNHDGRTDCDREMQRTAGALPAARGRPPSRRPVYGSGFPR